MFLVSALKREEYHFLRSLQHLGNACHRDYLNAGN
jgi:hypothetical protein